MHRVIFNTPIVNKVLRAFCIAAAPHMNKVTPKN